MNRTPQARLSLPGPDDITRVQLPNGITVLARANFNSPSIAISGYLKTGALFDLDEKLGLSDFTALALTRGTQKRAYREIYNTLESAGASFGYSSGTHTTGFGGKALAEDLDLLIDLLAETLQFPIFPPEQVERLRAQLLTNLAIRAQDTAEMASIGFDQLVYAGHPYGRPDDGTPESIQAISSGDLAALHARHYGPRGMVVCVVGAVDPQQVVARIESALGGWHNPLQPDLPALPPLSPLDGRRYHKTTMPSKSQADVVIGAPGPLRSHPRFLAASLGNNILGQFGMYGRIGDVVRERHGLAYYAYSSLSGGLGPGPWYVSAGVDPANVEKTIALIFEEIKRFTSEPVTAEELADSQANYIGRLPLSLESNNGVAAAILNLERYELGLDYYWRYPELVSAVTPAQILETAREYLYSDRLAVSVAGP